MREKAWARERRMRVWDAVQEALQDEVVREKHCRPKPGEKPKGERHYSWQSWHRRRHVRPLGARESLLTKKVSKLTRRRFTVEGRGKAKLVHELKIIDTFLPHAPWWLFRGPKKTRLSHRPRQAKSRLGRGTGS